MAKLKFEPGDTVYFSKVITEEDIFRHAFVPDKVFTKEEMLEELRRPKQPEVGEIWKRNNGTYQGYLVEVIYTTSTHVSYKWEASSDLNSNNKYVFLDRYSYVRKRTNNND